jgi:type IV secretion system protein VirD4
LSDWTKNIDPFRNWNSGSGSSGNSGLELGVKIGSAINKAIAGNRQRRQTEEELRRERERQEDILKNPPPIHGSARWATPADLNASGLLKPVAEFDNPSSLLLGTVVDDQLGNAMLGQLHWDGEGHLITIAPTRSGKSTTTIVPNLVRYKGSCVVFDPKGELYRETSQWRRDNVGPVYRLAPFEADTDAFNPLETLTGPSDARMIADQIIPYDPKAQDFFRKDAIAILSALIVYVAQNAPAGFKNLAEVRKITAQPLSVFQEVIEDMTRSGIPMVANAAQIVLDKDKERSLPSLRDTLNTEMSLWDDPGVAAATSKNQIDFKALKDQPATVYITVPFHKIKAYSGFLKILLVTALEAMVENPRQPKVPVLFILDEFLSLGPFPAFRDAIRTHAGAGVRLWFFLQNLSTLEEHYPQSWRAFFDATVKMFFGTDDIFTGNLISSILGGKTVAFQSGGASQGSSTHAGEILGHHASANGSVNSSVSLQGKPLLNGDEVVRMLSASKADRTRQAIISIGGVPPINATLVPWFLGEKCRRRVTHQQQSEQRP